MVILEHTLWGWQSRCPRLDRPIVIWMSNAPCGLMPLNTWSQLVVLFGMVLRCLEGGGSGRGRAWRLYCPGAGQFPFNSASWIWTYMTSQHADATPMSSPPVFSIIRGCIPLELQAKINPIPPPPVAFVGLLSQYWKRNSGHACTWHTVEQSANFFSSAVFHTLWHRALQHLPSIREKTPTGKGNVSQKLNSTVITADYSPARGNTDAVTSRASRENWNPQLWDWSWGLEDTPTLPLSRPC